jgi:hypothetical protein
VHVESHPVLITPSRVHGCLTLCSLLPHRYMVVGIEVPPEWMLLRSDLYPPLPSTADVVVWDYFDPAGSAKLVKANVSVLTSMGPNSDAERVDGVGVGSDTGLNAATDAATIAATDAATDDATDAATVAAAGAGGVDVDAADAGAADVSSGAAHRFSYKLVAPVLNGGGGWALLGEVNKLTPVSVQRKWRVAPSSHGIAVAFEGVAGERVTVAAWQAGVVHTQEATVQPSGKVTITFFE